MGILTKKHFEYQYPQWLKCPSLSEEDRKHLIETGQAELESFAETLEIHDTCFKCGGTLSLPYFHWEGFDGNMNPSRHGISLHSECAKKLGNYMISDALRINEMIKEEVK